MDHSLQVKADSENSDGYGRKNDELVSVDMLDGNSGVDRDHLINTAVKFLCNPRVHQTSLHQKLQFLRQKGLSEHEISSACLKAGIDTTYEQVPGQGSTQLMAQNPNFAVPSIWTKTKDVANVLALFSIASYSLYCFWKEYLGPKLFGIRSRNDGNYEKLLLSITKLNENVTELKDLIRTIQETQTLQKQLQITTTKSRTSHELKEIRNELSAIKSLLVGRTQFPTSPSSGIPSWQMLEAEGEDSNNSKDLVKTKRKERKSQRKQEQSSSDEVKGEDEVDPEQFVDMAASSSSTMSIVNVKKPPSVDSNNGFTSGSSCEVVFMSEKNDSNSEHSSE